MSAPTYNPKLYKLSRDQVEFLANMVRDHIDLSRYRALEADEIKAARGALVRIVEQAKGGAA